MGQKVSVGVLRAVPPEREQLLDVDPDEVRTPEQVRPGELGREVVVPGVHRGVRREDELAGRDAAGDREGNREATLEIGDLLERGEGGVPLVQVHDVRLVPDAANARSPPMPKTSSCWMRVSRSPP